MPLIKPKKTKKLRAIKLSEDVWRAMLAYAKYRGFSRPKLVEHWVYKYIPGEFFNKGDK